MATASAERPAVVYLTYDGLLEPLGESQVVAYICRLASDYRITVISYEKPADLADRAACQRMRDLLQRAGIHWTALRYHRRPTLPATFFDAAMGVGVALWTVLRRRARVLHARSYLMGMVALVTARVTGAQFLFDMRGYWADEKVEAGHWPANSSLYRAAKACERAMLRDADAVVTLTHAAASTLDGNAHVDRAGARPTIVIPTCVDMDRFRPGAGSSAAEVRVGYFGSIGTWYMFDEALWAFTCLKRRRSAAQLLIVTRDDHDHVRARLSAAGVSAADVVLRRAVFDEMPALMASVHAAVFFIRPSYAKQASSPTKLAELLACGVPCLSNNGVGDYGEMLQTHGVGVAIADIRPESIEQGAAQLLDLVADPRIAARCRRVAAEHFSLDEGVRTYRGVYSTLVEGAGARDRLRARSVASA